MRVCMLLACDTCMLRFGFVASFVVAIATSAEVHKTFNSCQTCGRIQTEVDSVSAREKRAVPVVANKPLKVSTITEDIVLATFNKCHNCGRLPHLETPKRFKRSIENNSTSRMNVRLKVKVKMTNADNGKTLKRGKAMSKPRGSSEKRHPKSSEMSNSQYYDIIDDSSLENETPPPKVSVDLRPRRTLVVIMSHLLFKALHNCYRTKKV